MSGEPITGMNRSRVKLDTQEVLEDACRGVNGKPCITGDSELYYVDSSSTECRSATVKTGDAPDAVFIPRIYEAVCSGPGNCRFDMTKPIGSACIADKDVMKTVRNTLGVKEPSELAAKKAEDAGSAAKDTQLIERSKEDARGVAKEVYASLENNADFLSLPENAQSDILAFIVKEAKRGVAKEDISNGVVDMIDRAMIESLKQRSKELRK